MATWILCDIDEDMEAGREPVKEAAEKHYKKWSSKLELQEVCCSGGLVWLKSAWVASRAESQV